MATSETELKHFKNLIIVAFADGVLDEFEKQFLYDKAQDYDLSKKDVQYLIKNVKALTFELPKTKENREDDLAEVVSIALIDDVLHPKEYQLCLSFAKRLELTEGDLEMAIKLSDSIGNPPPSYQEQLNKFINLILVADADRVVDEEELEFLLDKAAELEIPVKQANDLINNIDDLEFSIPLTEEAKEDHLIEIVHLALIDGHLHEKEYNLCFSLARRIGFSKKDLDKAIELAKRLCKHIEERNNSFTT
mgnify:CR=1 FL=1|tara:strand:- start:3913 stop:4659 length:747 start_codon:yes stop_codon:yes gene_type:complete